MRSESPSVSVFSGEQQVRLFLLLVKAKRIRYNRKVEKVLTVVRKIMQGMMWALYDKERACIGKENNKTP
ncbi:MAG: hypothetical protein D3914_03805 [Candidatus Electrothrix sp. LOE2]|nr:hypothetical protein [Candidatus Electrothrix sp. LOE2]